MRGGCGGEVRDIATAEGWPTLTGSSKQVVWAEGIRADAMAQLATERTRVTISAPATEKPEPTMTLNQAAERSNLESAFAEAGERAAHAQLARAAAIAEIGELLRRANSTKPPLVGITDAQWMTQLTRPTLTDARSDEAVWRTLSQLAAGARDGNEEDLLQLHRRLPRLAGWYNAAEHLQRQYIEEYWAARGGFDPWAADDPGDAPGYEMLMAVHDAEVASYAAGEPAYLDRLTGRNAAT